MKTSTIRYLVLAWICSSMCLVSARAQVPVEISTGHSSYYYQHAFSAKFSTEKPFGFFHTSSLLIPYDKNRGNEIMSQSYVSYALSDRWSAGMGSIFTPLNRVRPSVFFQYFLKGRTTSVMVYPRADLWKDPNFELMGFMEYRGGESRKMRVYARLQYMTTWNLQQHVRSYQYLRVGINLDKIQLGPAVNIDQYGGSATSYSSVGLFVRKEFR